MPIFRVAPTGPVPTLNLVGEESRLRLASGVPGTVELSTDVNGYLRLTGAGAATASTVTDNASAVAHSLDTTLALTAVGSKILSLRNNGAEKAYADKDGALFLTGVASGSPALTLQDGARIVFDGPGGVRHLYASGSNLVYVGGFSVGVQAVSCASVYPGGTASLNLRGRIADSATAVGIKMGAVNTLSTAGSKIVAFYNDDQTTERAFIDYLGGYTAKGTFASITVGSGGAFIAATSSTLNLTANAPSTGSAVGTILNNTQTMVNGDKLLSVRNNNVEKFAVDYNGAIYTNGMSNAAGYVGSNAGFIGNFGYSITLQGRVADGATAVNAVIDTFGNTYATAGAKLLSIRNNTTEKAYFDKDGALSLVGTASANAIQIQTTGGRLKFSTAGTTDYMYSDGGTQITVAGQLGVASTLWASNGVYTGASALWGLTRYGTGGPLRIGGNEADGATAVSVVIDTPSSYATTGARIVSFRNSTTEKAYIDYTGGFNGESIGIGATGYWWTTSTTKMSCSHSAGAPQFQCGSALTGTNQAFKFTTASGGLISDILANGTLQSYAPAASAGATLHGVAHDFYSRYWNGSASTDYVGTLQFIPTATTPAGKFSFQVGASEKAYIDSGGTGYFGGSLFAAGGTGSVFCRGLQSNAYPLSFYANDASKIASFFAFPGSVWTEKAYIDNNGGLVSLAASGQTALSLVTGARLYMSTGTYFSSDNSWISVGGATGLSCTGRIVAGTFRAANSVGAALYGRVADGATAVAITFGNESTLSTAGSKIASFCSGLGTGEKAYVSVEGNYILTTGLWDDVPCGINEAGGASALTTELYRDTQFTGKFMRHDQDDTLSLEWQMPHSWDPSTSVKPHIHWEPQVNPGATQVVRFTGKYAWTQVGVATPADAAWTAFTVDVNVGTTDAFIQKVTSLATVAPPSNPKESNILLMWLRRPGNTDATDTYTTSKATGTAQANVMVLSIDAHYQKVKLGSVAEIP